MKIKICAALIGAVIVASAPAVHAGVRDDMDPYYPDELRFVAMYLWGLTLGPEPLNELKQGTAAEVRRNRIVAHIVVYCADRTYAQIGDVPDEVRDIPSLAATQEQTNLKSILAGWRVCEYGEVDSYKTLVTKFKNVDEKIKDACDQIPDHDSYQMVEICVETELNLRSQR